MDASSLNQKLEQQLPCGLNLGVCHISTPPTKCSPIFASLPGHREQKTFCESHLIAFTVEAKRAADSPTSTLTFALEILVFTTATLTTIFVSKADSTGYLHLANGPKEAGSPVRILSQTFLLHLVENRRRPGIPLVISLFARAQDQYLFPGSVENSGKHVLDDRGLIKWWCKVLDPVLREYPGKAVNPQPSDPTCTAYLTVPGYDRNEILALLPLSARRDPADSKRWVHGDPLHSLSLNAAAPPRSLIPRFPDDPKARFVEELDAEIVEAKGKQGGPQEGIWRTVKSMDQFWEMMQFRQECSSGRLVGFIWVVVDPSNEELESVKSADTGDSQVSNTTNFTQEAEFSQSSVLQESDKIFTDGPEIPEIATQATQDSILSVPSPSNHSARDSPKKSKKKIKQLPTGPIKTRVPGIKSSQSSLDSQIKRDEPKYYYWPPEGRGNIIVSEKSYQSLHDLLLRLDFSNLEVAQKSSQRWIDEVSLLKDQSSEGLKQLKGQKEPVTQEKSGGGEMAQLLVGRKRAKSNTNTETEGVKTLGAGLVRKKPKVVQEQPTPEVNVLGAGLVRKKAKN